jgi:hypothetical protein
MKKEIHVFVLIFLLVLLITSCKKEKEISIEQWQPANEGIYGGRINGLTVDPTTNFLYAWGDGGGVFLSTNNGTSWTAVNNGFIRIRLIR